MLIFRQYENTINLVCPILCMYYVLMMSFDKGGDWMYVKLMS